MKQIIQKYKNSPTPVKAAAWYTFCIFMQKLAAFLVIPFFTRILTTSEYGVYAVFLSWMSVFEIFATFKMYTNAFVAGLVRNETDMDRYTCSVQVTCLVTTGLVTGIAVLFIQHLSYITGLSVKLMLLMLLSFYPAATIGIWSAKQRVSNKYRMMVIVTFLYSVLAPIISIVAAYILPDKLESAIMARVYVQFIIAIPFFLSNVFGLNKGVVLKYCKEILRYSIPLAPYFLSMVLLNSSDRIMIKSIIGESEAAMYSVAYSISMAMFVFESALNLALEPWLLSRIKRNDGNGVSKSITQASCFIAILNVVILVASPEIITIVASERYAEAVWSMPPVIGSLLIMFIYQQFLQVHFYYGENKVVFIASMLSAAMNILLNMYCLPRFGYIVAGYTTLTSYLLIAVIYYCSMVKVAQKHNLDHKSFYNISDLVKLVTIYFIISGVAMLLYQHIAIRYILVALTIAVLLIYKNKIVEYFKSKEMKLI